jgi:hypothetical protein
LQEKVSMPEEVISDEEKEKKKSSSIFGCGTNKPKDKKSNMIIGGEKLHAFP